ncbi:MAG: class I SAM-dependent methyltransferase [Thermodesulfobacteriota bacterium]
MTGYSAKRISSLHTGRNHFWFRHRNRVIAGKLYKALAGISHPRILELGCGSGIIANYLKALGYEMTASDLNPGFQSFLTDGIDAFEYSLGDDPPPERAQAYDALLLGDVIEHIRNPVAALQKARGFIRPGGILLVTVPAMRELWSELDDFSLHVKRYGPGDLRREMQAAGYAVESLEYFMFIPAVILYIQRGMILGKGSRRLNHDSLAIPGYVNAILEMCMRMEYHVLKQIAAPFGSSLITIGRKS